MFVPPSTGKKHFPVPGHPCRYVIEPRKRLSGSYTPYCMRETSGSVVWPVS